MTKEAEVVSVVLFFFFPSPLDRVDLCFLAVSRQIDVEWDSVQVACFYCFQMWHCVGLQHASKHL